MSGEKALKLGLDVIAKITGYADAAQVLYTTKFKFEEMCQRNCQIRNLELYF